MGHTDPPTLSTVIDDDKEWEEYEDDNEATRIIPDIKEAVDANGRLINQQPAYDKLINSKVSLQQGDDIISAKVTRCALGPDGTVIGRNDDNPMLNLIVYEVEFPNGQVNEYSVNTIAENMQTQVDSDGFTMTMMDGIIGFKKDHATAVSKNDMYFVTKRGKKRM
jgi:hypothetical protein